MLSKLLLVIAGALASAAAQTLLDPGQVKGPIKTGPVLPATCSAGDMFFNTTAPAGANLYGCAASNTWTVEGGFPSQNCWYNSTAQVLECQDSQGNIFTPVKTASAGTPNQWVDYIAPTGIAHTSQPTATQIANAVDQTANYSNPNWITSLAWSKLTGVPLTFNAGQIQGRTIAGNAPADLQYLGWNNAAGQWEPKTLPPTAVSTVFGRTGAVTPQNGDYTFTQIGGTLSAGQLPVAAMRTDQSNAISSGTQDFSHAAHTLPMKSGVLAGRPAACSVGEGYFATDAPAGSNYFGCTAANVWTTEGGAGVTVAANGLTVGASGTLNFIAGQGFTNTIANASNQINVQSSIDPTVVQTLANAQSGITQYCASAGGSASSYQCSLTPALTSYSTGMVLNWHPDINGAGGATTLAVNGLGAVPLTLADGVSNPGTADIVAGRLYNLWYDGRAFRIPNGGSGTTSSAQLSPGTARQILIYNADGVTAGPSACSIGVDGTIDCGDGSTYSGLLLPELTSNGVTTAGTASAGSAVLTVVSGIGITQGQSASGPGISPGTYVVSASGASVTLSQATTAALSNATVVFTNSSSIYGAANQPALGCIVWPVGLPTNGQVLSATSSTTTIDGKTCTIMQWSAVNAATATALAATPAQCSLGQVATGIQANGNANCTASSAGGTVTSVGLTVPAGFTAGAAVTNSGNLTITRAAPGSGTFYYGDEFVGAAYNTSTTYVGSGGVYTRGDLNGTGSIAQGKSLANSVGAWNVCSGTSSGNASTMILYNAMGTSKIGSIPSASATAYTYQTRFGLNTATSCAFGASPANTIANTYFVVGLVGGGYASGAQAITGTEAVWCDVTSTSSAGTWTCHSTHVSGSYYQTDVSTSVTANTNPHLLTFVISTTEVDYYMDGTKIACLNTGGAGGCTAFIANGGAPASSSGLMPYWQASTSAASQVGAVVVDKWEVWQ